MQAAVHDYRLGLFIGGLCSTRSLMPKGFRFSAPRGWARDRKGHSFRAVSDQRCACPQPTAPATHACPLQAGSKKKARVSIAFLISCVLR
jgi:hypothetical protein